MSNKPTNIVQILLNIPNGPNHCDKYRLYTEDGFKELDDCTEQFTKDAVTFFFVREPREWLWRWPDTGDQCL